MKIIEYKGIDFEVEFQTDEAEPEIGLDFRVNIISIFHQGDDFTQILDNAEFEQLILDKHESN